VQQIYLGFIIGSEGIFAMNNEIEMHIFGRNKCVEERNRDAVNYCLVELYYTVHRSTVWRRYIPYTFHLLLLSNGGTRYPAVPTIKNCALDSPDEGERRGQFHLSAMAEPHPGGTAFMITVTPAPSKFMFIAAEK